MKLKIKESYSIYFSYNAEKYYNFLKSSLHQ